MVAVIATGFNVMSLSFAFAILIVIRDIYRTLFGTLQNSVLKGQSFVLILQELHELHKSMKNVNRLLSGVILFLLLYYATITSISVSVVADNLNRPEVEVHKVVSFLLITLANELSSYTTCKASQTIADAMRDLYEAIENRVAKQIPTSAEDKQTIEEIQALRKQMALKANVFNISLKTYFTIVHIITTYAIILLQTN